MTYGATKRAIFEALDVAGGDGVNTATVVAAARERGLELNRNSVSSVLCRLHREGLLDREPPRPERYRLR